MRIGLFTSDFPFKEGFALDDHPGLTWGGVAEVVYQMAIALSRRGHQVEVFTASPLREEFVQEYGGVQVFRYKKDFQVASTVLSKDLVLKPLERDLDLVHGHLGTPPGAYAASFYARRKRRPLVLTIHTPYNETSLEGATLLKRLSLGLFMNRICQPMLERAAVITSVSSAVLADTPGYHEFVHRIEVVPNGVDVGGLAVEQTREECRQILDLPADGKIVLFVGSLSPYKNPRLLLDAFARLEEEEPKALLVFVGGGPLREELSSAAQHLGLSDRVRLAGFVSEQEKRLYYRAADLLVLPSLAEAFPLVLLEAGAFSLPLVVSDIEVLKAVVKHGENGLVFSGGVEGLRDQLVRLLANEDERATMAQVSRAFANDHDWVQVMNRYDQIYRGLVP